ncbi:P27 family phage terminase small subunit [Eggerthella sinensis]|uniref:P27 family phage terminase small subunit n=1 Tax=Eggerthella sinensis TaxID=242230 RepID=UPI001313DCD0|nr:P27 family phage terminase small subunit [Eggerthella sinensis]
MSRGRKPEARLAKMPDLAHIVPVDAETGEAIEMPPMLAMNPYAEQAWHLVMDNQTRFRRQELPLIEQYCVAYAISRQALDNMANGDGTIQTNTTTAAGDLRQHPDIKTWAQAANQMRQLSGVLGLDTLTAERLKLTQAATTSLAADIPKKVMAAMREMRAGDGG